MQQTVFVQHEYFGCLLINFHVIFRLLIDKFLWLLPRIGWFDFKRLCFVRFFIKFMLQQHQISTSVVDECYIRFWIFARQYFDWFDFTKFPNAFTNFINRKYLNWLKRNGLVIEFVNQNTILWGFMYTNHWSFISKIRTVRLFGFTSSFRTVTNRLLSYDSSSSINFHSKSSQMNGILCVEFWYANCERNRIFLFVISWIQQRSMYLVTC